MEEINAKLDQRGLPPVDARQPHGAAAPTDIALDDRLELRPTERYRKGAVSPTTFGICWRLDSEAAEAVCSGEQALRIGTCWSTLPHYLTRASVSAELSKGATRYRLLETVRQYARDRLMERDEGYQWRARHLGHFLVFTGEAEPQIEGSAQPIWLDRLDTEHENLRAALEWSLEHRGRRNREQRTPGRGESIAIPKSQHPIPCTAVGGCHLAVLVDTRIYF